ncbi:MAG TPA: hypothetical protein PK323_11960 [Bacteroidia bacterium]|nr:hypothetical protein [Bacteroidia bacterium]
MKSKYVKHFSLDLKPNGGFLITKSLGYQSLFLLLIISFNTNAQIVYNNGAVIAIKAGANMIVKTGSFTNASGTVDNAGLLQVEGNYTNNATSNGGGAAGVYKIQNNWVNNATFTANNSQVELYGANQLITGTSSTNFYQLTLTGTGIKTQTLDASVSNLLELNDRELATDNFKMIITNTNVNAITRTTGFVSSLGNGRLSRAMSSVGTYLFSTGSSVGVTRYRPITITPSTSTAQQYEVRLANNDPNTDGFNRNTKAADVCEVNPNYFHHINKISGTSPVSLSFYYDALLDGNWASVGHWQNIPQWQNTGIVVPGVAAPFTTLTIASWSDFNLSPFALVNLGPNANITGSTSFCVGASTTINFTGTPNAVITYNINGGPTLNLTLNGSGSASINTGALGTTTVYNLLSAYMPATPSCVQNFTAQATVTVIPIPLITPIFHD